MEDSARLVDRLGLNFAVLRDADMSVIRAYGVAMKGQDLAVPAVFIVRRDGTIAYHYVGESQADRPSIDTLVPMDQAMDVRPELLAGQHHHSQGRRRFGHEVLLDGG